MKAAARAPALIAVLAVAAGLHATFAGMPDWAMAAAEAAPPVPEGMPDWPERTLLAETSIVVSQDGATWRTDRRKVVQILSNRVEPTAAEFFPFDDTTKIKKSKGWHLPPGEHARRNFGGALDLRLSGEFLTDAKARVVALEGVKKGSLVAYEFEAESRPYTLTHVESFYDDAPVSLARFSIELPPGWTLKYDWLPGNGPAPTHSGATWMFERTDVVPQRQEALGEAPVDVAPRLVVALQPPDGLTPAAPAFSDWNGLGRWFQELSQGRETVTPEVQAAATEALAKAGPAPLDRIRAVSLFARDRVRYLAREVGIGGYQPHRASEVLSGLYGDCKDKGTLLRALLQAAGFRAYPILIHATNPYTVAPEVPAPGSFNHFVVGVVWPSDRPFPDEAASAKVDAGDAGTVIVIDPTDEDAWPGTLPGNLAGKTGAVVVGGRVLLLTLPEGDPKWNRIDRKAAVAMAADGSIAVQLASRMYGAPAEASRREYAASSKDRRTRVEDDARATWPGIEVGDYKAVPEDADGAYVETLSLALPAGSAALQNQVYWVFAGVLRDIERVSLGKRVVAVQYPFPCELRYEAAITGAAAATALPSPVKLSGAGWSVQSDFRREGETMHAAWTADLRRTHFEPAAFPDLKQFWSAAAKAAAPGITLGR